VHAALTAMAGRPVRLAETPIASARGVHIERLSTEFDKEPGTEGDIPIGSASPPGSLFDFAPLHLVTQATLDALGADVRRFRPNLVVDTGGPAFAENAWLNRQLRLGPALTVLVVAATSRCVIPTLAQRDVPADPTLLRRINAANRVDVPLAGPSPCVGVYAVVLAPGAIALGDRVTT
ncbi:MAG: MOSC domain-containing protein, partial [Deltaproteobacteria bacterium]|nr:MOSC domain-containing protein [Kofleriaceae bacterium]